jgi:hypothetical protein
MRFKIPRITHDEAVSAFIKGLRHHDALKSKLLWKRSSTVSELLATAKNYADADDTEKIIKTWVGHHASSTHRARMINPMTVVRTTTTNIVTGTTTTIATVEIIVIGGLIITVITEASVLAKTTMRSTRSRNMPVTVTIKRITTKL